MKTLKEAMQEVSNEMPGEQKPDFEAWLAKQPKEQRCDYHDTVVLTFDEALTRRANINGGQPSYTWAPKYSECEQCREEKTMQRLIAADVPSAVMHGRFTNWEPTSEDEKQHLEQAQTWATTIRKGFLVLLGPVGTGKTHLAVACMASFRERGVFIKQSTLLRNLRATYKDDKAKDPIKECQRQSILVLDEMGFSGGGRDEAPMLHEILDYRYLHKLPTVITSNLSWDALKEELGERLADRFKEAAYGILVFSGESHRKQRRDDYFNTEPRYKQTDVLSRCF